MFLPEHPPLLVSSDFHSGLGGEGPDSSHVADREAETLHLCSLTKATVTGRGTRKPSGLGSSQLSHGRVQSTPFQTPSQWLQRLWSLPPCGPRELWGPAWLPGSPGSPGLPSRASSSPRLGNRDGTVLASSSQDPAQGQLRAGAPANGN